MAQPFTEHLEELRRRIISSAVVVALFSLAVYGFHSPILQWLASPARHLYFISPQEALVAGIRISLWGGLLLAFPYILFQTWQFLTAGLLVPERRALRIFIPVSVLLFYAGLALALFLAVPVGLDFLLRFSTDFLTPMITVSHYVSFVASMMLAFGLILQLPVVLVFLARIGLVTASMLTSKRRHAVVLIFIAAAVLSPPDVVTQFALALPLLFLYELSIWGVKVFVGSAA